MPVSKRPSFHDWFAVSYLRAAKFRRDHFSGRTKDYYEGYFTDAHVTRYENDLLTQLRRLEIAAALEALPNESRVADVGCGVGDVLAALPTGLHRLGVDYSLHSLRLTRHTTRAAGSRISLANASLFSLPFASESLDAVICLEVLEHLEDDLSAALDIARVLRPGGLFVVSVPSTYYFSDYLHLTGHFRHYTRESLGVLLEETGLRIERPLRHYPNLNSLYVYIYATLAALNLLARVAFNDQRTLYDRRIPIVGLPLYSIMSRLVLRPLANRERCSDTGTLPSATFLLARKPRVVSTFDDR